MVAAGTGMNDDGVNDDEGVAVGAGLGGTEADVAELGGATDDRLDDYVAFSATGVVVKVTMDYAHTLHGWGVVGGQKRETRGMGVCVREETSGAMAFRRGVEWGGSGRQEGRR